MDKQCLIQGDLSRNLCSDMQSCIKLQRQNLGPELKEIYTKIHSLGSITLMLEMLENMQLLETKTYRSSGNTTKIAHFAHIINDQQRVVKMKQFSLFKDDFKTNDPPKVICFGWMVT